MSTATYPRARLFTCPDGHAGQHGAPLRTIVPDGLDLTPACTACHQEMTPGGGPLSGKWRVDDCCIPAGPDGRWAGPPRDPAACARCFGTRRAVICTTCLLPGCPGDHGDTCLACDGTGRVDCAACDGEGHVYNEFSEDQGLCPDFRCVAGRVPCEACDGAGQKAGALPGGHGRGAVLCMGVDKGERGRVLVTGVTEYVAGHCVTDLLARGYDVRGPLRDLTTADIAHLRQAIDTASGAFDLAEATLDADEGWAEAVRGCAYVLHVASPIPFKAPRRADEIIRPAVDGTVRVLMTAAQAGVKRVVCTSSLDTITRNGATAPRPRTEADWSDLAECGIYAKSKLLAERRAWDLGAELGIELAIVHPGAVIGPPLQVKRASSADIVRRMLAGEMPAIPPLHLAFTDVRDLAAAHRLALEVPGAKETGTSASTAACR